MQTTGAPAHAPFNKKKFLHDYRVGVGRLLFYQSISFIALFLGSSYGNSGETRSPTLLDCLSLSALLLPFSYSYSLPFELAIKEHFPLPGRGKAFFTGPYALIGITGAICFAVFGVCFYHSITEQLLPLYVHYFVVFAPLSLSQFLFTNRYRHLTMQRGRNDSALSKQTFFVPLIGFASFVFLFSVWANFQKRELVLLATLVGFIAMLVVFVLAAVIGDLLGKNARLEKPFAYESPFIREPFVLFSILVLPFAAGNVSGNYFSQDLEFELPVYRFTNGQFLVSLVTLFGVGLVFELLRYLGRYHLTPFARSFRGEELVSRFRQSVRNYTTVFVIVLLLWPLQYFMGNFTSRFGAVIAITVILLIFLALGAIKKCHYFRGSLEAARAQDSLRKPCNQLVVIKIVGYYALLGIIALSQRSWAQYELGSAGYLVPLRDPRVSLAVIAMIAAFTIFCLSQLFAIYNRTGNGTIFNRAGLILIVVVLVSSFSTCITVLLIYFDASSLDVRLAAQTSIFEYWAFRLRFSGDAVYLSLVYLGVIFGFWIINEWFNSERVPLPFKEDTDGG